MNLCGLDKCERVHGNSMTGKRIRFSQLDRLSGQMILLAILSPMADKG